MKASHEEIIAAVLKKAEDRFPGELELLGIYGSAATGDLHERSDLDLLIVTSERSAQALSEAFILDDEQVGYDIYCTSWQMLEEDAECRHANLGKLMDSGIVYSRDEAASERLESLRRKAAGILASDERYSRAGDIMHQVLVQYALAMAAGGISERRGHAAYMISLCLSAVMISGGRYFRMGVKRTFEEIEGVPLPERFRETIYRIIGCRDDADMEKPLTELLRIMLAFTKRTEERPAPTREDLAGTYEEMVSNWSGKMEEAAQRNDVFSSFMNMASLQFMFREVSERMAVMEYDALGRFDPDDLEGNAGRFGDALKEYLEEYEKAGLEPARYADARSFAEHYLNS